MIPLLALAENTPTTLAGALTLAVSALAGAVVWLVTRLLTAKDQHAAKVEELYRQQLKEVEPLVAAVSVLDRHSDLLETLATRGKK